MKIKIAHLHSPVIELGVKVSSLNSKNADLIANNFGITATSRTNGRTILIPWPNIRGAELLPTEAKKKD